MRIPKADGETEGELCMCRGGPPPSGDSRVLQRLLKSSSPARWLQVWMVGVGELAPAIHPLISTHWAPTGPRSCALQGTGVWARASRGDKPAEGTGSVERGPLSQPWKWSLAGGEWEGKACQASGCSWERRRVVPGDQEAARPRWKGAPGQVVGGLECHTEASLLPEP